MLRDSQGGCEAASAPPRRARSDGGRDAGSEQVPARREVHAGRRIAVWLPAYGHRQRGESHPVHRATHALHRQRDGCGLPCDDPGRRRRRRAHRRRRAQQQTRTSSHRAKDHDP